MNNCQLLEETDENYTNSFTARRTASSRTSRREARSTSRTLQRAGVGLERLEASAARIIRLRAEEDERSEHPRALVAFLGDLQVRGQPGRHDRGCRFCHSDGCRPSAGFGTASAALMAAITGSDGCTLFADSSPSCCGPRSSKLDAWSVLLDGDREARRVLRSGSRSNSVAQAVALLFWGELLGLDYFFLDDGWCVLHETFPLGGRDG